MVVIRTEILTTVVAALLAAPGLVDALKVVSMPMTKFKRTSSDLEKRASGGTITALLANDLAEGGIYAINASIGTPPQPLQFQLDTGSSDLWMYAPGACGQPTCPGGTFDTSKSSTYKLVEANDFEIEYDTPGSKVVGDYIQDNCEVGGMTIDSLIMAVAKSANETATGIMGIGFDTDESLASQTNGQGVYPNIVDMMVNQSLINSRAYSLYLNDLTSASGSILFGGYDTEKFVGSLVGLKIQPDQDSGKYTSMTVAWTSLSVTSGGNTTTITSSNFAEPAVLDSGTTLTILPDDIAGELINAAGAIMNETIGTYTIPCDTATQEPGTTINFGFEGASGTTISVGLNEFVVPIYLLNGQALTDGAGNPVCQFGIAPAGSIGGDILFGDTFLRSAYVVYDLDNLVISIAPTNFGSTTSNIVEINKNGVEVGANGQSTSISVASGVTAAQTATNLPNNNGGSLTGTAGAQATSSLTLAHGGATGTAAPGSHTSGAPSVASSKSAATGTLPGFNTAPLAIALLTIVFTVMGTFCVSGFF